MSSERKFVVENVRRILLKEYIKKETERAGFGGLDIQRTPMGTRVTLIAERPGMVIGRKGGAIKDLTETIEQKFKFDNPQIEVQEVANPNLNAQIMAYKLAEALERGWHFRRAGHSTVRRIMDAGAKGCQVTIAGKLTGERHRTEKFTAGNIKYCGEPAKEWMSIGYAIAMRKPGVMGVKVKIMHPDAKLPDDIEIIAPKAEVEEVKEEKAEEKKVVKKAPVKKDIKALKKLKKELKEDVEIALDVEEAAEELDKIGAEKEADVKVANAKEVKSNGSEGKGDQGDDS